MPFEFIADRPVLDFLPTRAARGTDDVEMLRTGDDLAVWVSQSGIVDEPVNVGAGDLERATTLREAMFRLVAALIDHTAPSSADRDLVNTYAACEPPRIRLEENGIHRYGGLDAVLSLLARDCLDLHDSTDRDDLHWCADTSCTRPFIDRSRGRRRRWCGMKGCGDRAKAAAYRRRHRAAAAMRMEPGPGWGGPGPHTPM